MKKKERNSIGGVVIKSEFVKGNNTKIHYNDSPTHNLVIGTTGSGKTQGYIFPSILSIADSDASMVINDPKGELYQKSCEYLKSKGYHVFVMDYFEPLAGSCFNQLYSVEREYEIALDHKYNELAISSIIKIISILCGDKENNCLSFYEVEHFDGTRNDMPSYIANDLVKGRYRIYDKSYDILRITDNHIDNDENTFDLEYDDIDNLKIKLIDIIDFIKKESDNNHNCKDTGGLMDVLYHNDYLYYRESEVIKRTLSTINNISGQNITEYYKSKVEFYDDIIKSSDPLTFSYKKALEQKEKYTILYNKCTDEKLNIDKLLTYLEEIKEDESNGYYDHETNAVNNAGSIARILVGKSNGGDKFWENTAISLQKALILFVCRESHLPYSKHLGSVNRILANLCDIDSKTGKTALDYITDRFLESDAIRIAMSEMRMASDKTKASILSSAAVASEVFGDSNIADQSSRCDFDSSVLVSEKSAIFLISPGNDDAGSSKYTILSTLFIEELYSSLNRILSLNEDMTLSRPVYFLLDEIANIPPIPSLGSKISLARSKNIRFSLIIQSYEQLKQHYKESYDTIRENSNILYILSNNTGTAKEISERIGKMTIEVNSFSNSAQKNGSSSSTSTSIMGRDLFTPQEIMQLKEGSAIYLMQRQQPYLTHLEPLYKWPIYKWLIDHKIENIHIKRQRQKINFFCPDVNKYTIAYESLYKDVLLDKYIYDYFANNNNVQTQSNKSHNTKVTTDANGDKAIIFTNDNGEEEKVYL